MNLWQSITFKLPQCPNSQPSPWTTYREYHRMIERDTPGNYESVLCLCFSDCFCFPLSLTMCFPDLLSGVWFMGYFPCRLFLVFCPRWTLTVPFLLSLFDHSQRKYDFTSAFEFPYIQLQWTTQVTLFILWQENLSSFFDSTVAIMTLEKKQECSYLVKHVVFVLYKHNFTVSWMMQYTIIE